MEEEEKEVKRKGKRNVIIKYFYPFIVMNIGMKL